MSVVANLVVRVSAATTDFEKDLKGLQGKWNRLGSQFESAGATLTKNLTVPIVAVGAAALKFSVDFETAMTKVQTLSNSTATQVDGMRKGILALAPAVGKSPQELADGLLVITSTGLQGAEAMSVLEASAKASAVGLGSIPDVARAITAAVTAYGTENLSAARAADILFQTVVEGGAEAADLSGELGRVFGVAQQLGVSFEEVGAFVATYTRILPDASEATTGLYGALNTILAPSKEAKEALDLIGVSADQLRKQVSTEGLGETLIDLLGKLKAKGGVEAIAAVFGNVRALGGVLGTAGAQAEQYRQILDRITGSTGLLGAAFLKWGGTTAATWAKFTAGAQAALIAIGDKLAPAFSRMLVASMPLLDGIVKLVDWFSRLPQPVQATTIAVVGLAAALGPLAYGFAAILKTGAGLFGLLRLTGVAGVIGAITSSIGELGAMTVAFGWEGFAVTIGGWGTALGGIATAAVGASAAMTALTVAIGALSGLAIGSYLDTFDIGGLHPSEWVEFLWNWKLGLGGVDAATMKLALTSRRLVDNLKDMPAVAHPGLFQVDAAPTFGVDPHEVINQMLAADKASQVSNATALLSGKGGNFDAEIAAHKAAQQAAKAHADAIKQIADGLSGLSATKDLKELTQAWKSLSPAMQESDPVMRRVLDKWMQIGPELTNVPAKLAPVVAELNKAALAAGKFSEKIEDGISNIDDISKAVAPDMWGSFADVLNLETPGADNAKSLNDIINALPDVGKPDLSDYIDPQLAKIAKDTVDSIDNSFKYFAGSLSGGMAALLGGVLNIFKKGADKQGSAIQKLFGGKGGQAIGGLLDIGMGAFGGGVGLGEQFGKGKGALGGAASGALSGAIAGSVVPVIGTAIGAVVGGLAGLFGGLFGGGKKHREEMAKMSDAKAQLVEQFGSMEKLQQAAQMAGVSVDLLFSTDKAKVFQSEMTKVTDAIKVMQERIATTVSDIDKVMSEGGLIGKDLWQNILKDKDAEEVKAKLAEVFSASVERSAEGFNKIAVNFELLKAPLSELGVLADAAFAGLIAGGASIPEAIAAMGDGLAHIQEILAKTGQTPTGPLADILNYQKIVQANTGLFELLSGVTDMLTGLGNSGLLTQTRFAALGATITQAFGQLQAQGVAGATAIELLQPGLQRLWEAQQMFGLQTDAATQSLINQAVQQGVVGENMKDVNGQILDVLKAIATALGAEIPGALTTMATAAGAAVDAITPKFQALKNQATGVFDGVPRDIDVNMRIHQIGDTGTGLLGTGSHSPTSNDYRERIPAYASGGYVNRPTLAMIGEAGPEFVVPEDEYAGAGVTVNFHGDIYGSVDQDFAVKVARAMNHGKARTAYERLAR